MSAILVCEACERFTNAAACPLCGEPGTLREATGAPGALDGTRGAVPAELAELADQAHDVVRRLDGVIGRCEQPSELHSIALLAKDCAKRAARRIDQFIARACGG